jgi:hypothetical protein
MVRNIFLTVGNSHVFHLAKCHEGFLGVFARLQKATMSFVMSACPHGTTQPHWTDFHES